MIETLQTQQTMKEILQTKQSNVEWHYGTFGQCQVKFLQNMKERTGLKTEGHEEFISNHRLVKIFFLMTYFYNDIKSLCLFNDFFLNGLVDCICMCVVTCVVYLGEITQPPCPLSSPATEHVVQSSRGHQCRHVWPSRSVQVVPAAGELVTRHDWARLSAPVSRRQTGSRRRDASSPGPATSSDWRNVSVFRLSLSGQHRSTVAHNPPDKLFL